MPKTWTAKEVERVMLLGQNIVSLNEPVLCEDDDMHTEIGDFIEDPEADVEEMVLRSVRIEQVQFALDVALKPREAEIVRKLFGFTGVPMTLEEVGKDMCLTRERVRQLKERALRKLRIYFLKHKIMEEDI